METVISILIGSGITWFVTQWYYRKAAEDLQKEAVKLRTATEQLLKQGEQIWRAAAKS